MCAALDDLRTKIPPTVNPPVAARALSLSLAANAILLGAVIVLVVHDDPGTSPPPPIATPSASPAPPAAPADVPLEQASAPPSTSGLTPDTLVQIERLGLPRDLVVSAVLEGFQRRWDGQFAALEDRYAPRSVPEREYIELGRLRDAARARELTALLGEAGYRIWDQAQTMRMLNTGDVPLSANETEALYRLQKEFEEQHRELQMAMEDGIADMADASALQAQAMQARDLAFEGLLGRERLDRLRGLSDPVADVARHYADLAPTPAQTRAVLELEGEYRTREAALAERLKGTPANAATIAAEIEAMQRTREDALRHTFGAEAYETNRRQNDPTYRKLAQFAAAWELREDEIRPVYETLRTFHDQAERTRQAAGLGESAGHSVNWREINAGIEEARRRTEAVLRALIGDSRADRLKQNDMLLLR